MIYHGQLSKAFKDNTRFHVIDTYPEATDEPVTRHGYTRFKTPHIALRSGDRMTVFNSIAAGNILWKGELQFLSKNPQSGAQPMGMNKDRWEAMFAAKLPIRLTKKNGEIIDGLLEKWNDWDGPDSYNIFDFKNNSYESLHTFGSGDVMEIFSGITAGNIVWQGEVKTIDVPFETGQMASTFDEKGYFTGQTTPELIGNALVTPSIKEVRKWQINLPVMLERNEP